MKFSQMPYSRPELDKVKSEFEALNQRLATAESYADAKSVFLDCEKFKKHLSNVRN